ncbi:MAG: 3-hydroxyacyl-CoA dehydrogenase NAD-binding domain-containing protein [Casimicrobiaceae bacterium]
MATTAQSAPATGVPASAEVGVIGAGAMGAGIAQLAAQAGHRVHLFDTRMGAADAAAVKIAETFATLAAKGKLEAGAATAAAARVIPVHALGDLVSAKLVVEAIVEDLEIKRQLFAELEVVVTSDTILATNTSSFSITALAVGLQHPERVVGMHFFNPAPLMPLVEVIRGISTSAASVASITTVRRTTSPATSSTRVTAMPAACNAPIAAAAPAALHESATATARRVQLR